MRSVKFSSVCVYVCFSVGRLTLKKLWVDWIQGRPGRVCYGLVKNLLGDLNTAEHFPVLLIFVD